MSVGEKKQRAARMFAAETAPGFGPAGGVDFHVGDAEHLPSPVSPLLL